ncbi:UNVERIFIED_CONTAM: Breast cancer 2, early onset [Siphonaria sp. JEL0065]|nr:Breast cancer 2, early onset [Siphonaria sp. JEL0065]
MKEKTFNSKGRRSLGGREKGDALVGVLTDQDACHRGLQNGLDKRNSVLVINDSKSASSSHAGAYSSTVQENNTSVYDEISEQELLAYVVSGAMDFTYDDFLSQAVISNQYLQSAQSANQTKARHDHHNLETLSKLSNGFVTANKKRIDIPQEQLDIAMKLFLNLDDDDTDTAGSFMNGSKGEVKKSGVATIVGLSDLALNATRQTLKTQQHHLVPAKKPFKPPTMAPRTLQLTPIMTSGPPLQQYHIQTWNSPQSSFPKRVLSNNIKNTNSPNLVPSTRATHSLPPYPRQSISETNVPEFDFEPMYEKESLDPPIRPCYQEEQEGQGTSNAIDTPIKSTAGKYSEGYGGGFMTGNRKRMLPPVSEESILKASRILDIVGDDESLVVVGNTAMDFNEGCETIGGFTTGNKKKLAPVSRASLSVVTKVLDIGGDVGGGLGIGEADVDEVGSAGFPTGNELGLPPPPTGTFVKQFWVGLDTPSSHEHGTGQHAPTGFSNGKGKALAKPSKENIAFSKSLLASTDSQMSDSRLVGVKSGSGFSTGKGRVLARPSDESMRQSESILNSIDDPSLASEGLDPDIVPTKSVGSGFSTGKGRALPKPSEESFKQSSSLLSSLEGFPGDFPTLKPLLDGFSTAKGRVLEQPSKENLDASTKLLSSIDSEVPKPTPVPIKPMKPLFSTLATPAINTPKQKPFKTPFAHLASGLSTPVQSTPLRPHFTANVATLIGSSSLSSLSRSAIKSETRSPAVRMGANSGMKPFRPPTPLQKKFVAPSVVNSPSGLAPVIFRDVPVKVERKVYFDVKGSCPRVSMRERFGDSRQTESVDSIDTEILDLNSITSKSYHFTTEDEKKWGPSECQTELLQTWKLSDKKVTIDWVTNHYRWIVWKLAAMVRSFPRLYHEEKRWKKESVVGQMLYRYQREYGDGKRSCLNLIIEGDRAPDSLLCLCVADVFVGGASVSENNIDLSDVQSNNLMLELTDGWYSLKSHVDPALCRAIKCEKLRIGIKLLIHGAMVNGEVGSKSALEIGDRLSLKICANGTRVARWDTKLGYQTRPVPFQVGIGRIVKDGGAIPLIDAVIMRVYPIVYVEKNNKQMTEAENEEEERKYQTAFANECERLMAKYQKTSNGEDFHGVDIAAEARETFPPRSVSRKRDILICDVPPEEHSVDSCAKAILSIWNPEGMMEILKEGNRVKFMGLVPDTYHNSSNICHLKQMQKKIMFQCPITSTQLQDTLYTPRRHLSIDELKDLKSQDQFDVMGIAYSVGPQVICLVDSTLSLLKVQDYHSGFTKIKAGEVVVLKNLEYMQKDDKLHYSILKKNVGVIVNGLSSVEKEAKAVLVKFRFD